VSGTHVVGADLVESATICHKTLTFQRANRCEIAHVFTHNLQKIIGEIALKKAMF
jgi:hypothetical protein